MYWWHSSGVFTVDVDHSQHINKVFLLLTLNKYLPVGCERQVNVLRTKKAIYLFRNKKTHFIQRFIIAPNWNNMNVWPYYEHIINICFSSKFALGTPSVLLSFPPVIWSALSSLFPRDSTFFAISNQKPI